MPLEVGSVVEGVVTGITHFGAFVQLPDGTTGLVHISEVADAFVRDVKDFIKEQDKVKVKVLTSDERGKVGLSIRQADPNWSNGGRAQGPRGPGAPRAAGGGRGFGPGRRSGGSRRFSESFEDKLARFVKESDEKQSHLRKSTDSKRGGRGNRGF